MSDIIFDLRLLIGIVIIINLFLFLSKSKNRYWQFPVVIWTIIITIILIILLVQNEQINDLNGQYLKSAEGEKMGDVGVWQEIKEYKQQCIKVRIALFHLFGFQTLMNLVWQTIGYKKTTRKPFYKRTAITFGTIFLFYLIFYFIIGIIPIGSII
ncbi:hypothetical protein AB9K26_07240 [Psychroserpens sp. XS_ASV72]|uniref:hypothetical protein n=1 Tax=Psychroserpens sp. XS_ASV72 TaxID=3241293 RepID=UPI003516CB4C